MKAFLLILFVSSSIFASPGQDLLQAPPSFESNGKQMIPIDFQSVELDLDFNVEEEKAYGVAKIEFYATQTGYPLLDLVANASKVVLNGKDLGGAALKEVRDPDNQSTLRFVDQSVESFSFNSLEIHYVMPNDEITWNSTGVRVGFFMSDVSSSDQRGFLEQYAPANYEYDQFQMDMRVKLTGTDEQHQLFTNGDKQPTGAQAYFIRFPAYFTSSSFYFHISNQNFNVRESVYKGLRRDIPITIYASSSSLTSGGEEKAHQVMKELENTYGPYAHNKMVAYITSGGGGMEHCGATMTSLWALEHEFTHSWFARGVMPSSGNSGWIDEAMASWRDDGYQTYASAPSSTSNLGNFSAYRRTTTYSAYSHGAKFMAHLDHVFGSVGGLKSVMRALFTNFHNETITTPQFKNFLEKEGNSDLENLFGKYVYANRGAPALKNNIIGNFYFPAWPTETAEPEMRPSRHPRPYTKTELQALR